MRRLVEHAAFTHAGRTSHGLVRDADHIHGLEANVLSSEGSPNGGPAVAPGELNVVVSGGDTTYELRLLGELDMSTASQLSKELLRVTSGGARHVTVDLSDLKFIDSTGLSVLITGLKRLRQGGGDLALRAPNPSTRKVLEITGLTEVFAIS